ncbi:MAG: hypothetical protein ACT4P6_02430 [Gemmatimonadaceae bacterium]
MPASVRYSVVVLLVHRWPGLTPPHAWGLIVAPVRRRHLAGASAEIVERVKEYDCRFG